jgi:hypothetical protein
MSLFALDACLLSVLSLWVHDHHRIGIYFLVALAWPL